MFKPKANLNEEAGNKRWIERILQVNSCSSKIEFDEALKKLGDIIPHRLNLICDSRRFAEDFSQIMRRPYHWINSKQAIDKLSQDRPLHIITLYTGPRTDIQIKMYREIIQNLRYKNVNYKNWFISEWRHSSEFFK